MAKEIKKSPVKWAKENNLDPDLFLWWNENGLISKKDFDEIKNKMCRG